MKLPQLKLSLIIISVILLTGCSQKPKPDNYKELHFNSTEWLTEKALYVSSNPVNVDIKISPENESSENKNLYRMDFQFRGRPLEPFGVNPTGFFYFIYCVNAYHAARNGFDHWAIGFVGSKEFKKIRNLTIYLSLLDEDEKMKKTTKIR
ncbi:MAG: hypothetical protein ACC651_17895, partial [Candidatus Scalindua sp.]